MRHRAPEVLTIDNAVARVRAAQAKGESVVMGHGCFDIVHPGHVRHLRHAASLGDRLLVTVTGDAFVGKGAGRPLIPEALRAENLASLDVVDWAAVSPFPTAVELLETLRPDVYVKGREYEFNDDPRFEAEKRAVEAYGGRVVFSSGDVVFSSTALIQATGTPPMGSGLGETLARHGLDPDRFDALLEAGRGRRILVAGETILDTYVQCEPPEVAGESPMLTLVPRERTRFDGGAAIIARHLAALGARPTLLTALPPGGDGHALRLRLEVEGVAVEPLPAERPLVEKTRYLVGQTKVMKVDHGPAPDLDDAAHRRVAGAIIDRGRTHDAVILADYGLGLFTAPSLDRICRDLRGAVAILAGDVSGRHAHLLAMREMDLLVPTEQELRRALQDFESGLSAAVWKLVDQTDARAVIVTLAEEGLIAFEHAPTGRPPADGTWASALSATPVPAFASFVLDQLGCGDALLAATTLARAGGATTAHAAIVGSVAAAVQTQRLGNAVISAADLRAAIGRPRLATLA